jgi:hypothetical protein
MPETPLAGPEIAAEYAERYDGDLRIFLHQLCEISAICALPYNGAFYLDDGHFDWNEGAVVPNAGPGERSVLIVDAERVPVAIIDALKAFCVKCSIRLGAYLPKIADEPGALDRAFSALG